MKLGASVGGVNCKRDFVHGFVNHGEVGVDQDVKIMEDLLLWECIEETYQVIIQVVVVGGRIRWVMRR